LTLFKKACCTTPKFEDKYFQISPQVQPL